jgi:hypothetical protein
MKLLSVILLACILGAVLGNIINSAVRDIAKGEKTSCRGKVML